MNKNVACLVNGCLSVKSFVLCFVDTRSDTVEIVISLEIVKRAGGIRL